MAFARRQTSSVLTFIVVALLALHNNFVRRQFALVVDAFPDQPGSSCDTGDRPVQGPHLARNPSTMLLLGRRHWRPIRIWSFHWVLVWMWSCGPWRIRILQMHSFVVFVSIDRWRYSRQHSMVASGRGEQRIAGAGMYRPGVEISSPYGQQ